MSAAVRAWLAAALAALAGAAALHALALFGAGGAWAAMVHLTINGWLTAMIVAVSYHTLPVFLGRDLRLAWAPWAQLAAFAAGAPLASAGLALGSGPLAMSGLALEAAAGALYVAALATLALGPRVRRSPPAPFPGAGRVDRAGLAATFLAAGCLPLSLIMALAARAGLPGGEWALAAEHVGALGWVMLTVAGVMVRTLPRFSGRPLRGPAWVEAQLACHVAALALIVAGLGLGLPALFAAGGALMALALALLAWTVAPAIGPAARPAVTLRVTP